MKLVTSILVIVLVLTLTSCSTTESFSIYAPQDTKIYLPNNTVSPVGMGNNSKIKVNVTSDMFCGYILAQSPGSDIKIPIGLDYKTNKHTGTKAAVYTGNALTCVGFAALVGGGMVVATTGDEDTNLMGAIAAGGGYSNRIGFSNRLSCI